MTKVLILDYGSQFTQLIARKIRELGIYCEIHPFHYSIEFIEQDKEIGAIILSGGPNSIYESNSPSVDSRLFDLKIPILGVCYGMQLLAHLLGGEVQGSDKREYGRAELNILNTQDLFADLSKNETVWMSHGDHVTKLPVGFEVLASTDNCPIAAMGNFEKKIYGMQFHPEVHHTQNGNLMLSNFLLKIVGLQPDWSMDSFIEEEILKIKNKVGAGQVLCGLSGGVDSAVTAAIIHKAVGSQLHCVFVDHGLLRQGEREQVEEVFRNTFQIDLTVVDARQVFLKALQCIVDPEEKRKVIGRLFVEIFEESKKYLSKDLKFLQFVPNLDSEGFVLDTFVGLLADNPSQFDFLAQGTLYPDVVESVSFNGGPSQTIKSHHNVGGLPEDIKFSLIEPLRELFKDEVRKVGRSLGLPESLIGRHPFPGPGLAIRIIGDITEDKLETLRFADKIFIDELKQNSGLENKSLYEETWQAFCVLLPVQSVGVMGDGRTYEDVLALRSVSSVDGMTADWSHLPYPFLAKVSARIINEVRGINRVVYDISSKPPATIEWE